MNLKESQVRNAINFAAQLHDDVPMDTSSESNGSPDNPSPIVSSDDVKSDLSSDSNGSLANVPSPNVPSPNV